jgi:hypothetical protein
MDQAGKESFFARVVFYEREGAVGMDCDVVPGGNRKLFDIESGGDVAVGARENDKSFASGEGPPVGVCLGEVAFDEPVFAFILDDEREVRRDERRWRLRI